MLPIIKVMLSISTQQRRIVVHELDRQHIATPKRRAGKYIAGGGFSGDPKYPNAKELYFSIWQLVHAIRQAELLRPINPWTYKISTIGLFLECSEFLSGSIDLRLIPGATCLYGDFSRTALSGRVGQGIAFLFMRSRGYPYGERLEALLTRQLMAQTQVQVPWGLQQPVSIHGQPPSKAPDFLFESETAPLQRALVESKGSFVAPRRKASVKQPLKEGLDQIEGWSRCIAPTPNKSFVVGAFIREEGDPYPEPSMIAFVDPEGGAAHGSPWSIPEDSVRLGNYAAWLKGMGLIQASAALLARHSGYNPRSFGLPVVRINDQEFVLVPDVGPWDQPFWRPPFVPWHDPRRAYDFFRYDIEPRHEYVPAIGLALSVVRRISEALQKPGGGQFLQLPHFKMFGTDTGSIFNDGTFLGIISSELLQKDNLREENVLL